MFAKRIFFPRSLWTIPVRTGITVRTKGEEYLKDPCMKELFPGGPKYYPGSPSAAAQIIQEEPDSEPTKLFLVRRIHKLSGQPYWVKADMRKLRLFEWDDREVILRNSARVNAILWRVKHLVEIIPIKLPENFKGDPNGCPTYRTQIQDNGEFKVPSKIIPAEEVETGVTDPKADTRYSGNSMRWWLIFQWYQARNP